MNLLDEIKYTFNRNNNAIRKIIIVNVAVYLVFALIPVLLFLVGQSRESIDRIIGWLMLPASFSNFISQPWSIISYMFLHDGFLHILFNMLWLFWIGNILHEYLGNRKVYEAYFAGGIFGAIIFMLCYNFLPAFTSNADRTYALGASAGVLSVVVATATLLPNYPIQLFLFGQVKLKYIALVSILLDFISIPVGNAGGHIAHIGGALFGFLYIKYLYKRGGHLIPDNILSLFKRKPKMKIHYRTTYMKTDDQSPSQEEIDAVLDKISKSGYDSLNKREKEILFKASKD